MAAQVGRLRDRASGAGCVFGGDHHRARDRADGYAGLYGSRTDQRGLERPRTVDGSVRARLHGVGARVRATTIRRLQCAVVDECTFERPAPRLSPVGGGAGGFRRVGETPPREAVAASIRVGCGCGSGAGRARRCVDGGAGR
jgi:hypothetical protein